jgi:hypothetical protein
MIVLISALSNPQNFLPIVPTIYTTLQRRPCVIVIVNPNLACTRRDGSKVAQSHCPEGPTAIAFESRDCGQRLPPTTTVTTGAPLVGGRLGSGIVITPRAVDSAGSGVCTCVPASRLFLGGRLLASNEGVTDCRGLASNTKMHRKACC